MNDASMANNFNDLGIKVVEDKYIDPESTTEVGKQEEPDIKSLVWDIPKDVALRALDARVITPEMVDSDFDAKQVALNIEKRWRHHNKRYKIMGYEKYISTLNTILTQLRSGMYPDRSYLICSEEGMGKTSFIATAQKIMVAQGWNVVPFIPLHELASIWEEEDRRLLRGISSQAVYARKFDPEDTGDYIEVHCTDKNGNPEIRYYGGQTTVRFESMPLGGRKPNDKRPVKIINRFSWSEYMEADVLFVGLAQVMHKQIESYTLKSILQIRAMKGKPTIVIGSESIQPYLNDPGLYKYVWAEIEDLKDDVPRYNRLTHVSCYKHWKDVGTYGSSGITNG